MPFAENWLTVSKAGVMSHDYPGPLKNVLARLLVDLLTATLKFDSDIAMQPGGDPTAVNVATTSRCAALQGRIQKMPTTESAMFYVFHPQS